MKPKFSFTVASGEVWESPYNEDCELKKSEDYFDSSNFPKATNIKIRELKKILRNDFTFKRFVQAQGSANRVNKAGGFAADMMKPILISEATDGSYKYARITDGNHTANMLCHLYPDDVSVPVMKYTHSGKRAAKAFALWNKEAIKILSQEEVFPAQYMYGDEQAKETFDVLCASGRTFPRMPVGDKTFNLIAKNTRVTRRGYLERAIKCSQPITVDVLDLLKSAYPQDNYDNAVLTYALVKGLKKTPKLFEKDKEGLPADLFVEYFLDASSERTQDDWLFSKFRIHNKEAESIFAIILKEFLDYANKRMPNREWIDDLQNTFDSCYEMYYNVTKKAA